MTETIDRALALAEEIALFEAEVDRALSGLVGHGGFVDRFRTQAAPRVFLFDQNFSSGPSGHCDARNSVALWTSLEFAMTQR